MCSIRQKVLLMITDGIGEKPATPYNAFTNAKKPTYDWLFAHVPHSLLATHGEAVGLPEGQMGNSEVGHMILGAGRVLYQDLVKINRAIASGELRDSPVLRAFVAGKNRVHLIGLLSDGGVHSHMNHTLALAQILCAQGLSVLVHAITDGRDVPPHTARGFVEQLRASLPQGARIATISGRFYAMDRDNRWERVLQAYQSIAQGANPSALSPEEYISAQEQNGITDEFIEPASFGYDGFCENDCAIFVNFRSDRAREIVRMIGAQTFDACERGRAWVLPILCMTCYDETFGFPVLFAKEHVSPTLAEIFAANNLSQLHTAETEKYAHVTFFLNGGIEKEFPNERHVLVPSPKVKTYDLQPEMSAKEVGDVVIGGIEQGIDFIVVNFANGDMVGHTGNLQAAIAAVEAVDAELGRILHVAQEYDYAVLLTSDHGNCEEMADSEGNVLTNHTVGDVWCFVLAHGVKELRRGSLANVAPSVLDMMGLPIPAVMEQSLLVR
ncbi:MAG: 2,3-bisphosphoglycerate-independent phosphoglycerate mutase [Helicobacter sp.]|nr:2,3-bisphosphoglycerate-independent phosphoglycerate mutase [Helicobacter sp.]